MGRLPQTVACTPNHNARKVLESFAEIPVYTIHKVLKIRPDNYETETKFSRIADDTPDLLTGCRILLIDEASFIDRDLFNLVMDNKASNCIVIALGNHDQLKPVSNKKRGSEAIPNEISPFFTDDRFFKLELTEIKRSDSLVLNVGEAVRNNKMKIPTKSYIGEDGRGVFVTRDMKTFIDSYFEHVKTPEDLLNNRMVAFSNDHVDQLNLNIRKRIYNTEELFIKDEILVAQKPCIERCPITNRSSIIFDNGTYLRIQQVEEAEEIIRVPEVPEAVTIRCFLIEAVELDVFFKPELLENGGESIVSFKVIHPDDKDKYKKFLERFAERLTYIRDNMKNVRPNWKSFFVYQDEVFLDVKYLPVSTIHKSQGITVDNIFYFVDYVANMYDQDMARRLSYVAITRARNNAYLKL